MFYFPNNYKSQPSEYWTYYKLLKCLTLVLELHEMSMCHNCMVQFNTSAKEGNLKHYKHVQHLGWT